jgi:hexosaminidase
MYNFHTYRNPGAHYGKKLLVLLLLFCCRPSSTGQPIQVYDPDSLQIAWKLLKNPGRKDSGFRCELTITNNSRVPLPKSGWKIYFNLRYHSYHLQSKSSLFEIKHESGELFYIAAVPGFTGLDKKQSIKLDYTGQGRIANYQDIPSGLFWTDDHEPGIGRALGKLLISLPDKATLDFDQTAAMGEDFIFSENDKIMDIPADRLPKIFPSPLEYRVYPGYFLLNESSSIRANSSFSNEAEYLATEIEKLIGNKPVINGKDKTGNTIILQKNVLAAGAYQLEISQNEIRISASSGEGIFYGIQSVKSMLAPKAWAVTSPSLMIPCAKVNDAPRFAFREFMLDVSRNFQSKKEILRILDLMSIYKLNVFHFHLTDDEGWRLEIPGLPELTDIGAKRGYPFADKQQLPPAYGSGPDAVHSPGTGYYTVQDYIEILKYATQRHIVVIPEIESPGHARAAVWAMGARYIHYIQAGNNAEAEHYLLNDPLDESAYLSNQGFRDNVMNAALPSTYRFMEKVIDEIQAMYNKAGAPLFMFHVGGDEVPHGSWAHSPVVLELMKQDSSVSNIKELWRNYFLRLNKILASKGLTMAGWEELAKGTQDPDHPRIVSKNPGFISEEIQLDAWWSIFENQDAGYELANAGYQVVLCPVDYFYLDLAYNKSFTEPGDAWVGYLDLQKVFSFIPYNYYKNTRSDMDGMPLSENHFSARAALTDSGKARIRGIKAALWEENISSPELLEYMLLPRLLAIAENAWAKEPEWSLEKDRQVSKEKFQEAWSVFANTVAKNEMPKLDYYNGGYNYRLPVAAAAIINDKVKVNCELPGLIIRYTKDGSIPTVRSAVYIKPLSGKGIVHFRIFNSKGRAGQTNSITKR